MKEEGKIAAGCNESDCQLVGERGHNCRPLFVAGPHGSIISSGEVMRYFCSAIRKVGLLVEPGFQVNFRHVVIVAPRTKRGSIFGVGLGSL